MDKNKYIQVYEISNFSELAQKSTIAFQVFCFLVKKMKDTNKLCISLSTLSLALGKSQRQISRGLKVLKDDNWIKAVRTGSSSIYMINPEITWKTKTSKREKASEVYKKIGTDEEIAFAEFTANVVISSDENPDWNTDDINKYKKINIEGDIDEE